MTEEITPEQWRTLVGEPVERRRIQLGLSKRQAAEAAGVSEALWRQIESGKRAVAPGVDLVPNPRDPTRSRVAHALGWPDGALDALLRGE